MLPVILILLACGEPTAPEAPAPAAPVAAPEPANPHGSPHGAAPNADGVEIVDGHEGEAAQVIQGGGYTYVEVRDGDEGFWIAGPQTAVKVGDRIEAPKGTAMANFKSPSLDRTFASIDLVPFIRIVDTAAPGGPIAEGVKVDKLEGGQTVAEVYGGADALVGTEVAIRGRVVKYTPNVLGTNFMHIQDGSGDKDAGTHDITVTTQASARIGDLVVIRGELVKDRDYGRGYSFPLLVDEAKLER